MRFGVVVLALLAGCYTRDHCVVGEQRSCSCDNAFIGIQRCTAEGEFDACGACLQADAAIRPDAPADAPTDAPPDATLLAPTGATCGAASECAGTNPTCLGDANGFPDGYCVAQCTPEDLDPSTGLSTDCPGAGWCAGGGCFAACTASTGSAPCRTNYSCTTSQGCIPTSFSQCDPNVAGSCPGAVCFDVGFDVVGICAMTTCNVFAQDCPDDGSGFTRGCYVANSLGETACQNSGNGSLPICRSSPDCAPGSECVRTGPFGTCHPHCGGPGAVACTTGTCSPVSPTIPTTTVGVCL